MRAQRQSCPLNCSKASQDIGAEHGEGMGKIFLPVKKMDKMP